MSKKETVEMPRDQAGDLQWFFGVGSVAFEKSTCGSMLDALERDSCTSKQCSKCRGQGIIGGDDYTAPGYGDWCDKCKGIGTLPVTLRRSKLALTARPKSQSSSGVAKTPSDKTLTRYASVSRRVKRLQERAPESVQILAAYYGNAGTRWAQTPGYTSLFPVIVLTQAGISLIKRYSTKEVLQFVWSGSAADQDAHEQLGQMYGLNKAKQDSNITKLFQEGFLQAEKLVELATVDWLATV